MAKDRFGCPHTPVRPAGWEFPIKAVDDIHFILSYKRPETAIFLVTLDVGGKEPFVLFGYLLSFCLNCGRFTHFGIHYDVCWVCASELEDDELEDEFDW